MRPVGVLGAACRLPGAPTLERFAQMSRSGDVSIGPAPRERTAWGSVTGGHARGGFLPALWSFENTHFGISDAESEYMDVQQRLILQVAWNALEDAGLCPSDLDDARVGVFVGQATHDFSVLTGRYRVPPGPYYNTGISTAIAANRLSYLWNLRGPSLTVDTACSSSLVALHLATRAIRDGECDLAIVAGANALLSPTTQLGAGDLTALSATGRCRPFDAAADGYVRSEGAAALLIGADEGRCTPRGWVHGTATNQDGRTNGLTAPSGRAQVEVIERAMAAADVRPRDVAYVELHGTGTPLGDPIEAKALSRAMRGRDEPLVVGAGKGNIGHTEAGAGLVGVVRALNILTDRSAPPQAGYEAPNPRIDLPSLGLHVPTDAVALGPGLAGISSFGFGGTNAHVLVSGPAPAAEELGTAARPGRMALVLSASTRDSLRELAQAHERTLRGLHPDRAHGYTGAAARRVPLRHRAAVVAGDIDGLTQGLAAVAETPTTPHKATSARPVFVYSGHGSQWLGMGRALMAESPTYAATITDVADAFSRLSGLDLVSLFREHHETTLEDITATQAMIFASQIAITRLIQELGVQPVAVLGHSVGEVSAAVICGELDLESGARVIVERNLAVTSCSWDAGMLAVESSRGDIEALIADGHPEVQLSCVNGPRACIVAGRNAALDLLVEDAEAREIHTRRVQVAYPSHSTHMEGAATQLAQRLGHLKVREAAVRRYSSIDGEAHGTPPDGDYWARNLRRTVNFEKAVRDAAADGGTHFIEVAPRPVLDSALHDILPTREVITPVTRDEADVAALVAALFTGGLELDAAATHPGRPGARDIRALPLYPFAATDLQLPPGVPDQRARQQVKLPGLDTGHVRAGRPCLSATSVAFAALYAMYGQDVLTAGGAELTSLALTSPLPSDGQAEVDLDSHLVALPDGNVAATYVSIDEVAGTTSSGQHVHLGPRGARDPHVIAGHLTDVEFGSGLESIQGLGTDGGYHWATLHVTDLDVQPRLPRAVDAAVTAALLTVVDQELATRGRVDVRPVTGIGRLSLMPLREDLQQGQRLIATWPEAPGGEIGPITVRDEEGRDLVQIADLRLGELTIDDEGDGSPGEAAARANHAVDVRAVVLSGLAHVGADGASEDEIWGSSFADLGLDSVRLAELRRRIERDLGVALPMSRFWKHPTPAELVESFATPEPNPSTPRAESDDSLDELLQALEEGRSA